MEPNSDHVLLEEQQWREVLLSSEDIALLRSLNFEVGSSWIPPKIVSEDQSKHAYVVNPRQYVGHFLLPSGIKVIIKPKIETSNIFRTLAYIYAREHPDPFRKAEVSYKPDQLLFEPLVELFNTLVSNRVRRGLYQNYIEHED